jgi:hypothetical protein
VDERPSLTKHQKAVADAVVAALRPLLKEINQKLDMIVERLGDLLARLDAAETAMREAAARRIDLGDGIDRHGRDKS